MLEGQGKKLSLAGGEGVPLEFKPFEIKTLIVTF
jgi:hypothetical protein